MTEQSPDRRADHERELYQPIPLEIPSRDGYEKLPIRENGEPLAALGPFSGNKFDRIFTDSLYAGERKNSPYPAEGELHGSLVTLYLREGVAEQLARAEKMLPKGMHLVVWDGHRRLEVQQSLFDQYRGELKSLHTDWSDEKLDTETKVYVSKPSTDETAPSTHNTGGSVDLDIVRLPEEIDDRVGEIDTRIAEMGEDQSNWQEVYRLEMKRISLIAKHAEPLNFGTLRDHGDKEAAVNYFEVLEQQRPLTPTETEARDKRRLLYNVMRKVELQPLGSEWWHYNSDKTQMGAKAAGLPFAEYGTATFSDANEVQEAMRRGHLKGSTAIAEGRGGTKLGKNGDRLLCEVAQETGHPRETTLPKAAEIAPSEEEAA